MNTNALDDLVLHLVSPLLYATEIRSHLNARRFLFIVADKSFETQNSPAVPPAKCTFARLYPYHKSIDFKEFQTIDEDSPLRQLNGFVEYTDLVHRLNSFRDVIIHRVAVIDTNAGRASKEKKLVSQYAITGHPGMVLLFHSTAEASEFVDTGNLLAAIITFNTEIFPEFTSMTSIPVFEARPVHNFV